MRTNTLELRQQLLEGESFDLSMDVDDVGSITSHSGEGSNDEDSEGDLEEVDTVLRGGMRPLDLTGRPQPTQLPIATIFIFMGLVAFTTLTLHPKLLAFMSPHLSWLDSKGYSRQTMSLDESCIGRLERLEARIFAMSRDWVGMQDFALRYNGGRVAEQLTTQVTERGYPANGAIVALDDDVRPGQCWRVEGSSAQLGVHLRRPVRVTNITIDHVPKELVNSAQNAPRNIIVWGQPMTTMDEDDTKRTWETILTEEVHHPALQALYSRRTPLISDGSQFLPLAFLEYDVHARDNIQTFSVFDAIVRFNVSYQLIIFDILDNWGATSVCLYRVRVHGNGA